MNARRPRSTADGAQARWFDIGAMAIAALMVGLWIRDPAPLPAYSGPIYDVISCVSGAASIAALWWRRRFPLVLACALLVCSTLLPVVSGPSLVALFTVAGHSSLRPTIWATLLALCSTPVQVVVGSPLRDTDFWRGVLALSLAILLVVGWGIALRSRRQVLESLQERARALARERDLVADGARRAEREEIARDVHDSLAHRLSLISMSAGALNYRREEIPAELAEQIATLQGNSRAALGELRSAIGDIRTGIGSREFSIDPANFDLLDLVEDAQDSGQEIDETITISAGLSPTTTRIVYRTVQELLTNARKHSPDQRVHVRATGDRDTGVRIMMANALSGTTTEVGPPGFGLVGVAERVKMHGGRLTAGPTAAGQFEVNVWLPWKDR
ncbi:sensor histidine kinase [Brachybacterium alimentarium]|uniref:sensor histidine kinase n=1 Tax=Brachybacterium alimentarium TaxID=47845 RepID=UPI003FD0EE31